MTFIALFLLLICHLISGYGLLTLFGIRQKMAVTLALSLILGIAVASFVPFLLQLCFAPITAGTVFLSLAFAALLLNIPGLLAIRKKEGLSIRSFSRRWMGHCQEGWLRIRHFRLFTYEIPFLFILGFLVFVSVWRCYYLPPTSRDVLSGPEAIAEFAVREHTMINSFFSVDLFTTNNQFKSPFLISLQIIYKMAGLPFGQLWLSIIFVSFTVLLYQLLKQRLHPILAGLLSLLFMMTPELYAYTFMILYDYSNMVFFFLSLYFLFDYFKEAPPGQLRPGQSPSGQQPPGSTTDSSPASPDSLQLAACSFSSPRTLYFAGLLMGIATYIRSETLVLAVFFIPALLLIQFRKKYDYRKMALATGLFILPALIGYYLPVQLYIRHYLPIHYDIGGLVNNNLSDLQPLIKRYGDMFSRLLTGELAIRLWGYIMFVWAALFLLELITLRRFNKDAHNWLYAIVVVFVGLGLLGYLLPLFDLIDTTKRGLFKILPLMLLYMANNKCLIRLSVWLSRWENARPAQKTVPGKAPVSISKAASAPNKKTTVAPPSHKKKQRK